MNKSRTKHFNFLSKRQNRYAIRHFSAGTVSVLVGVAFLLGGHTSDARKLDDVVDLFNAHLHHKKAWSDNPYYDRVQQRLNKIMEDE
ncbi:YSIRK-type signal peptide-containing protein [Staphylococcus pseudintermedius]|nr:YSIRK-type signal peptide-containing protein [Staphylococcus pseudintermedius]